MKETELIKLLLIDDDDDDVLLTRELLAEIKGRKFETTWIKSGDEAVAAMTANQHDVCLLDYRLGAHNGIELLHAALANGCNTPVILLTGMGEHDVDLAAMKAGAADYLEKSRLQSDRLGRAIRYAVERKRAAARASFEQARLSAFGAEIGLSLAKNATLGTILDACAGSMVQYLNAAMAQIWIYRPGRGTFESFAVACPAGEPELTDFEWSFSPVTAQDVFDGPGVSFSDLSANPRNLNPMWLLKHQFASFAARPLQLENRYIGMMSVYARSPLPPAVLQEMGSVANGIALCIERKLTEEALDASENRYRHVVESIKEIILQVDQFGNWFYLNPAWSTITGFNVADTLGTFFIDYIHHDDREQSRAIFLQLLNRTIDFCRYETRLLTKDGKTRWVELYMQLNVDASGHVISASGSIYDITERREAESQARKLAAFPRVNPNPVLEFNADGALSYANDAANALVRSLNKDSVFEFLPKNVAGLVQKCLTDRSSRQREEMRVGERTLTWAFFPVEGSQVVHCYGADITERLNLEAQFRHSQKLESVGQLAAGIAHDFNNILTVIQGYAELLLTRCKGEESVGKPARQINESARRAAALTRQLLAFSRKQVIQPRPLNLTAVLQNFANMLPRLLGEQVRVQTDYAADLPDIEADTGMLEQIVMNLAVNARDAMPRGGRLILSTGALFITDEHASRHADAQIGRSVCLTVTDTGCGMDEKILARIFEPFFSTKEVGKGTGLGLATVYGIVKQHRGWIEVTSEVGVGTTFRIYFPALESPANAKSDTIQIRQPVPGGQETILLVEDEAPLRELVREILRQYNYRVVEAASGVEALKVWDAEDGKVDLLLTDMVMPEGMNGRELAVQLRQRKPALKVIYTSGYSADVLGAKFNDGETAFLQKPYQPPMLAQRVRECLDAIPKGAEVLLAK
ncbi:MAG: response regulator [Verrucomicrobia bacterium]|nr:MAG: response regulator [Verrucomicrobiota bacterium]